MDILTIYLDFDGTVVEHEYPEIGRCNFGSFEVIKKLQDAGHRIILNTYRADLKNGSLEKAIKLINEDHWMLLKEFDDTFELKPITEWTTEKIYPHRFDWERIKASKELFIDDIAQDMPLKKACMVQGNMVDWDELDKQFLANGLYKTN